MKLSINAAVLSGAAFVLVACGGGQTPSAPGAPVSPAIASRVSRTVLSVVSPTNFPLAAVHVVFRRGTYDGPLIGQGKTNKAGRIRFSGDFGSKACASAQWQRQSAHACWAPVPPTTTLKFQ